MEQYRNCNRTGCGRYPAQPNLMPPYANGRNAGCPCGHAGNGNPRGMNQPAANNRTANRNGVCDSTMHMVTAYEMTDEPEAIGMAYVPNQEFGDMYDAKCGLREGTMFPALNLIFCGVRGK